MGLAHSGSTMMYGSLLLVEKKRTAVVFQTQSLIILQIASSAPTDRNPDGSCKRPAPSAPCLSNSFRYCPGERSNQVCKRGSSRSGQPSPTICLSAFKGHLMLP